MARTQEQVLDALDRYASTLSGLASTLGVSRQEAEQRVQECTRRGLVVPPLSAARSKLPDEWAPYLVLTSEGEQVLAEMRAARPDLS